MAHGESLRLRDITPGPGRIVWDSDGLRRRYLTQETFDRLTAQARDDRAARHARAQLPPRAAPRLGGMAALQIVAMARADRITTRRRHGWARRHARVLTRFGEGLAALCGGAS